MMQTLNTLRSLQLNGKYLPPPFLLWLSFLYLLLRRTTGPRDVLHSAKCVWKKLLTWHRSGKKAHLAPPLFSVASGFRETVKFREMRQAAAAGSGVPTGSTDRSEFTKRIFFFANKHHKCMFSYAGQVFIISSATALLGSRYGGDGLQSGELVHHWRLTKVTGLNPVWGEGFLVVFVYIYCPEMSHPLSPHHLFCLNQIFILSFLVSIHFFYLFFKTGSWILHHVLIEISKPTDLSISAQLKVLSLWSTMVHWASSLTSSFIVYITSAI